MPQEPLYAVPTDEIPARSSQAAAIIHMLLNNLDPRYTIAFNDKILQNYGQCLGQDTADTWSMSRIRSSRYMDKVNNEILQPDKWPRSTIRYSRYILKVNDKIL